MKRKEIQNKFDEIVDFSGVEKFLDTPLKHYSSGMQLRLAFAVAAFLEPEILLIDEVLAVGDAEFQNKCMGKMNEVAKSGRTIIFVSHNMSAVETLCSKAVFLNKGNVNNIGTTSQIIDKYRELLDHTSQKNSGTIEWDSQKNKSIIKRIEILCDDKISPITYMGCKLEIRVYFDSPSPINFPVLGLVFKDHTNTPLIGINNRHYANNLTNKAVTKSYISMTIPHLTFFEGIYHIDIYLGDGIKDFETHRECFQIIVEPLKQNTFRDIPDKRINKFFIPNITWKVSE